MNEDKAYIENLKMEDVPWHRLTTLMFENLSDTVLEEKAAELRKLLV